MRVTPFSVVSNAAILLSDAAPFVSNAAILLSDAAALVSNAATLPSSFVTRSSRRLSPNATPPPRVVQTVAVRTASMLVRFMPPPIVVAEWRRRSLSPQEASSQRRRIHAACGGCYSPTPNAVRQRRSDELHAIDAEASAAFAAEAERCAHLLDREEPRTTRRGAWGL